MESLRFASLRLAALGLAAASAFCICDDARGATLGAVSSTAATAPNLAANARSQTSTRAVSDDGCRSVFSSGATNLVPGQDDLNGSSDVFLHDCSDGSIVLVSRRAGETTVTANSGSSDPVISPNGRWIAFGSQASDLLAGGVQNNSPDDDLYLYDTQDGTLRLINADPMDPEATTDLGAGTPVFSGDSSRLAFTSAASNLFFNMADNNNGPDVFLYTLATAQMRLVSRASGFCVSSACTANGMAFQPSLSSDGRWVAFTSTATNLAPGLTDVPGSNDVFLWDGNSGPTGSLTLVSRRHDSATTAVGERSESPALSADGTAIAYVSRATNLIAGQVDANGDSDVFLWEAGANQLLSHKAGQPLETDDDSFSGNPAITADGSHVAFTSVSDELIAGQVEVAGFNDDLFLHDTAADTLTLVTHLAGDPNTAGNAITTYATFSADGAHLVYSSRSTTLVAGQVDGNDFFDGLMGDDIFRYTLASGVNVLASHAAGQPAQAGRFMSYLPSVSADGSRIVYTSEADDIAPGADGNDERDVLRWDAAGNSNLRLSVHAAGADPVGTLGASEAVTSSDGRWVAFTSPARNVYPGLVDDDSFNTSRAPDDDVFLLDRQTGTTILVSRNSSGQDTTGNDDSQRPRISGDGRYVVFESAANDLVAGGIDSNNSFDVFLFDRDTRTVRLLSRSAANPAFAANALSGGAEIARDGGYVVFTTQATDLLAGGTDANGGSDVYLHDIAANTLRLVSRTSASATTTGNGAALAPSISADGRYIAFQSSASNHGGGPGSVDLNGGTSDVFLFDRTAVVNPMRFVSRSGQLAGFTANGASSAPKISADGRWVSFLSQAGDLLVGSFEDNNGGDPDLFLFDRDAGQFDPSTVLVSAQAGGDASGGDGAASSHSISDDGGRIAYLSAASNLSPGQQDAPFSEDLFVFERATGASRLVSESVFSPGTAVGASAARISGDGSAVLFESGSYEIAEGLTNAENDTKVWLHFVEAQSSLLLSRSVVGTTTPATGIAELLDISVDGALSLFRSSAPDLVAYDGNGAYSGEIGLDVFAFERALGLPTITAPADAVVAEDQPTGALAFTVGDADGSPDDLTVTARSSDQMLFPNGNLLVAGSGAQRTVTAQPASEQSGSAVITLRAIDGDGNIASATFSITVTLVNDAPQLSLPPAAQVLEGGNTGLLDFTVDDPDHDESDLLFTVSSSDPAIVPAGGIALAGSAANRRIRVTPAPDAFGTVQITVNAEDPDGTVGSSSFEVEIVNINDEPSFTSGGNVTVDEDEVTSVAWATNIDAGPFEGAQQLSFEVVNVGDASLFATPPTVSPVGVLSFVPAAEAAGSSTVSVRLRDDGGVDDNGDDLSPTVVFTVTVEAVNDEPTITGPATVEMDEDGNVEYAFTVGDAETDVAALTVTATSSNDALVTDASLAPAGSTAARTLAIAPLRDANGSSTITLTVTDGNGASETLEVQVTVAAVDETVDLVTTLDNGIDFIQIDATPTWMATVANEGDDHALGVHVFDNAPAGMQDIAWTCQAFDGAQCGAASGTGALDVSVTLPAGSRAEFGIEATVTQDAGSSLAYAVQADVGAATQESTPADNVAVDIDAVGLRVFYDGFED